MIKRVVFQGVEASAGAENFANEQLEKVADFLNGERLPVYIDLIFKPSKVHAHHFVELRVKSPNYDLVSSYEGPDFYDTIEHVIDVLYHQIHEKKDKLKDEKKMRGRHEEVKKQR
jgi:ribosome-associated translation inhibitor RaiA